MKGCKESAPGEGERERRARVVSWFSRKNAQIANYHLLATLHKTKGPRFSLVTLLLSPFTYLSHSPPSLSHSHFHLLFFFTLTHVPATRARVCPCHFPILSPPLFLLTFLTLTNTSLTRSCCLRGVRNGARRWV